MERGVSHEKESFTSQKTPEYPIVTQGLDTFRGKSDELHSQTSCLAIPYESLEYLSLLLQLSFHNISPGIMLQPIENNLFV